jgi:signal transduction histidine kinase
VVDIAIRAQDRLLSAEAVAVRQCLYGRFLSRSSSQNKSHFIANMSHELHTPLNASIKLTEMMVTNARASGRKEPPQRTAAVFAREMRQ